MGVKFAREYDDIISDLSKVIGGIPQFYDFLDMNEKDWLSLDESEQKECLKTLTDDVFFALGSSSKISLGQGTVIYDKQKHRIMIDVNNVINMISLI
ncbi:hypothetical protein [Chengkuizengella axinellae]|uniref:Uncharacterized protein n=1 Tax=Chengkuizengella axinellae TaxID=3064388 RepID=A0ABT9J0Z3_9BACL|nr:hypothetical protein [Chengkuizengella sp. 2205SS18-9]MDP5274679.1 hypothetical protein [Chengkuizengella sp. 2205SS18-9]